MEGGAMKEDTRKPGKRAAKRAKPARTTKVRPIEGEFYFVVKVEPVNLPPSPPVVAPMFVGTIHRAENSGTAAVTKVERELEVLNPEWQSKRAFKFVVQDMNSDLDTLQLTRDALKTKGQQWLQTAVDHAILKVVIRKPGTASKARRRAKG
jgi:hypothetical protein